ncbi:MAG: alpha/beta hydrolase-fold protein [Bacteroidota bacterium]|jgi:predicted alpha/beta superfamily hydrolase
MRSIKYYSILVLLQCSFQLFGQNKDIIVGRQVTVRSKILNQDRQILIYLPASYDKAKKYPVIYLLDGKQHTVFTGSAVGRLADAGVIPEMIVVGIPNWDRTKDLTPTHTTKDEKGRESDSQKTSGGGNNFVDFIEKELFKYVDSAYSTMNYRIFVGHSYAGLLVTNTLFSDRNLFNSYISIDPSLYWDNYYLVRKINDNSKFNFNKNILYTSSIIDYKNPNDSSNNGVGIGVLEKLMQTRSLKGLDYVFENFTDNNHGSVPPISIIKGLRYIFRDYYFPNILSDSIATNPAKIYDHFAAFSIKTGINFLPSENTINNLGYYVLEELKNIDKAIEIFKVNTTNYPKSSNAFDSLASAYLTKGDNANAIKYYQISVDLNPDNKDAVDIIKRLKKGK